MNKKNFLACFACTEILYFVALLFRTTGLHNDESAYMIAGMDLPFGSFKIEGKTPLFYAFNYQIYHKFGRFLGSLAPISWHVVYVTFFCLSLVLLVQSLSSSKKQMWLLLLVLGLSPLALLNGTEVMAETLTLGFINYILFLYFDFLSERFFVPARFAKVLIVAITAFGMLIKPTLAFALIPFMLCFWKFDRRRVGLLLALGVIIGFSLDKLFIVFGKPQHVTDFGGPQNLFKFKHLVGALPHLPDFLPSWLFLVWPPLLFAALWAFSTQKPKPRYSRAFWGIVGLSFFMTLLIQMMVNYENGYDEVRYRYIPAWACLIAFAYFVSSVPWLAVVMSISFLPVDSSLWRTDDARFDFWPLKLRASIYHSAGTIFAGSPIVKWLAISQRQRQNTCIYLPQQGIEDIGDIKYFFSHHLQSPRYFDEAKWEQFQNCEGPKLVYSRRYEEFQNKCDPVCNSADYRYVSCSKQIMLEGRQDDKAGKTVVNKICLP